MEKEILQVLSSLLDEKLNPINESLERIENKVDGVQKDLCFIEKATSKNWNDIASLKSAK